MPKDTRHVAADVRRWIFAAFDFRLLTSAATTFRCVLESAVLAAAFLNLTGGNIIAGQNTRFFIKHWDTGDGLPQNSVISTIQTKDGYLCVGTLDGLARFDGVHFEKFYDANTPGLNSTKIVRLFEDSHTNFWIGTENAGIVLVD